MIVFKIYSDILLFEYALQPPQGLLPILEGESKTALPTDAAFVKKCSSAHRKHSNYGMAKSPYPSFTIRHYTAAVSCWEKEVFECFYNKYKLK